MVEERRKDRSSFKDVALQSWLQAVAARHAVEAIAVGDAQGLLVACGIAGQQGEELAASAARRLQPGDRLVIAIAENSVGVVTRPFVWHGERLHVLARGENIDGGRRAVQEAIEGIERILARP